MAKVLLLIDGRDTRKRVADVLLPLGAELLEPSATGDVFAQVASKTPDVIVLSGKVLGKGVKPTELVSQLRNRGCAAPIVLVLRQADLQCGIDWMAQGAQAYVRDTDLESGPLLGTVGQMLERAALREEAGLGARDATRRALAGLLGGSAAMCRVRNVVTRVARSDATVLLRGETGSGKEVVARAIHELSPRALEPFVAINCSALPGNLVESLLFGHERGAFTGADTRMRGQLEVVGKGTLLLDEIAEMPTELQAKLLRVLEQRSFHPLGRESELPLRARILASTHVNLEERVRAGRFRQDLFYRLNVLSVRVPSLSERTEDIPELTRAFARDLGQKISFTDEALQQLALRAWAGNVRELRNVVERACTLVDGHVVDAAALAEMLDDDGASTETARRDVERIARAILSLPQSGRPSMEAVERAVVEQAMRLCNGNKSAAARMLGFERRRVDRRISGD